MVAAFDTDGRGSIARGRGRARPAATAASSISAAHGGVTSEVRSCGAFAYVMCMYMHLTAY